MVKLLGSYEEEQIRPLVSVSSDRAEGTLRGRSVDGIYSFCNPLWKVGTRLVSRLVFRLLSSCIRCLWCFFVVVFVCYFGFINIKKNLVFTKCVCSPVAAGGSEKSL